jgi:hypothetical protein
MKAAAHELKGLIGYYSCNIPGLNFPLMALIDYKGFRVIAMSILPINAKTIKYGMSNNFYLFPFIVVVHFAFNQKFGANAALF